MDDNQEKSDHIYEEDNQSELFSDKEEEQDEEKQAQLNETLKSLYNKNNMELKLDTKNMNMDLEKFNGNQLNGE